MRNLKKFLCMALTVLMVVGCFAMTSSAKFDDVTDYQEAIEVMSTLGIIKGVSETEFQPDEDVTRWQMALLITKMMTGKVSDEYVETNLKNPENLTAFTDITADNYIGSINYANNNGIVVGATATTYEPDAGIKLQDVFTMVVRMLGYGSTAMNNNYPWSYIDKAIALGLDAGLPADYSNEAVATRGEAAQILFNALTALKADDSTLGADFFNLQKKTIVITGVSNLNMYLDAPEAINKSGYVAFNELKADGTIDVVDTYYAPFATFGIKDEATAAEFVGDSYIVRTNDNFATFLTMEACTKDVVENIAFAKDSATVKFDGTTYALVRSYSNLRNVGTNNNNAEIILCDPAGSRSTAYSSDYVLDGDLNIIGQDDKVLLWWVTTFGLNGYTEGYNYANLNGTYLYKIAEDRYVEPNAYIWSLAKKAVINDNTKAGFQAILKTSGDYYALNDFSDTILYDDDFDGDYDRGIFYQYKFGKVTTDGDYLKLGSTPKTAAKHSAIKYFMADGTKIALADIQGKYILYYYQPVYSTLIVKEIFTAETGLCTGFDFVNKTITFNSIGIDLITGIVAGEKYAVGANCFGASFTDIAVGNDITDAKADHMIGKNLNYIVKNGKILAIYDYANDAQFMVYVNALQSWTTMGYKSALVYFDPVANKFDVVRNVVNFNALDTYWYGGFANSAVTDVNKIFATGDALKATVDALGNYDVALAQYTAPNVAAKQLIVRNGIANISDGTLFGVAKITANTKFLVYGAKEENIAGLNPDVYNDFQAYKGIPSTGAAIDIFDGADVMYKVNDGKLEYIYVNGGKFTTAFGNDKLGATWPANAWDGWSQNSTIIYVDKDTKLTQDGNNFLSNGYQMYLGTVFNYAKAIDVIYGGFANVAWTNDNFTARLEAGNWYYVKDGYVVNKIDVNAEDSPIIKVFLNEAATTNVWAAKQTLLGVAYGNRAYGPNEAGTAVAGKPYHKVTDTLTGDFWYEWNATYTYAPAYPTVYDLDLAVIGTDVKDKDGNATLIDIVNADVLKDGKDTTGYYAYVYRFNAEYGNAEWPIFANYPVYLAYAKATEELPAKVAGPDYYMVNIKLYDKDDTEDFNRDEAMAVQNEGDIEVYYALPVGNGKYIKDTSWINPKPIAANNDTNQESIGKYCNIHFYGNLNRYFKTFVNNNPGFIDNYDQTAVKEIYGNARVATGSRMTAVTADQIPALMIAVKNDVADLVNFWYELQIDEMYDGTDSFSEVVSYKAANVKLYDTDKNYTYFIVQPTVNDLLYICDLNGAAQPYKFNFSEDDSKDIFVINFAITYDAEVNP